MNDDGREDLAVSATFHCLTGCAIGQVLGMVTGVALDWGNVATVALSVALAFLFGYSMTLWPHFEGKYYLEQVSIGKWENGKIVHERFYYYTGGKV